MTREEFEARKNRRISRMESIAVAARKRSDDYSRRSDAISSGIPFGQPILIGHHSEKRHRRDLDRMHRYTGKSVEEYRKAEYYERRAASAENNRSISSDDPDAPDKLRAKIEGLEKTQKFMKEVNRIVKKHKTASPEAVQALGALGIKENKVMSMFEPDFCGRVGFPSYALQNNSANIRRLKQRAEQLEEKASEETTEKEIAGARVVDNVDENRLQVFFDSIPEPEIRSKLKAYGFRWSRFNGCWQRMRSRQAGWAAEKVLESIGEK